MANGIITGYSFEYYIKDHLGNTRLVLNESGTVIQETHYYPFGLEMAGLGTTGSTNKYTYNGKEKQTDFGLDWLDYGARMYDASVGRFWVQDRFSEKYHWMNPYQYGANNPIKYIDVNGDSIFIIQDGMKYMYYDGKFYKYYNNNYNEYTPRAEDKFLGIVQNGLTDLKSKTTRGEKLYNYFAGDEHNVTFSNDPANGRRTNAIDMNSEIIYLTDGLGSQIPTTNGIQTSEFWLDMGHEMAHKQDFIMRGAAAKAIWTANINETEKYATHLENIMRAQAGMPLRTHYATESSTGKPYEPTRIINNTTWESLFYNTNRTTFFVDPVTFISRTIPIPINYSQFKED